MFYFSKMQGTGNDFIVIDYTKNKFEYSFKRLAEFLCNRHYGVGGDGILIIDRSKIADFKMRIFNSDGSEAEMCGNGIRCFAKYVFQHKLIDRDKFKIETLGGIKEVILKLEGETVISVKVDMGAPIFEYEKIPVIYNENQEILYDKNSNEIIETENKEKDIKIECKTKKIIIDNKNFYAISIGNPHVVCFENNIDSIDIKAIGEKIENYKYFPNKTNVEFAQIINENEIKVRIWERGVGETLACGTGACASAVISNLVKSTNSELIVDLKGGTLKISYDKENNKVFLEGEAEEIFEGRLNI